MESIPELLHRLLVNQADRGAVTMATACLAEIDPRAAELRLIRAGHDSPLLITPDEVVELDTAHGPALGLSGSVDWPLERVPLSKDAAIMLYTDGLTERRESPRAVRQFHDLAPQIDARAILGQQPGQALDQLLATTFPGGTEDLEDDVAVILLNLSRTPAIEDADLEYAGSTG
jgi:serine phosphatase RsbU (regulator of sigma subunit)